MTLPEQIQIAVQLPALFLVAKPFSVRRITDKHPVFRIKVQLLKR
jgi:hypothetical protein